MENKSNVFVLMPFADGYKEIYEEIYKKVCADNDFHCWRVDEISRPGSITQDIINGIIDASVIIADLTGRNANVFYELGIAHTIGQKTIMTAQSRDDVPFDISNYRVIFYEQTISGSKKLFNSLDKSLKEIKKIISETSNPVQSVLSQRNAFGVKQKIPILKVMNIAKFPKCIRDFFDKENILYLDDLKKVNLYEIKKKYKMGAESLGYLLNAIIKNNAYENYEEIQKFIVTNRVNLHTKNMEYLI